MPMYTGRDSDVTNPFVLYIRSFANAWSVSELERGISLLSGICCVGDYSCLYLLFRHVVLVVVTFKVDSSSTLRLPGTGIPFTNLVFHDNNRYK